MNAYPHLLAYDAEFIHFVDSALLDELHISGFFLVEVQGGTEQVLEKLSFVLLGRSSPSWGIVIDTLGDMSDTEEGLLIVVRKCGDHNVPALVDLVGILCTPYYRWRLRKKPFHLLLTYS